MRTLLIVSSLFAITFFHVRIALAAEFRGFWVDAFNSGFKNSQQIERILSDVRAANANAIVVEVRKRGDAYYNSNYEPKAAGIEKEFDPLAEIIRQAHDTNAGPRIEVHAWAVAYPVWRGADGYPSQTNHPYVLHPDWLDRNSRGETFDGKDYFFDPGHPEVQEHIFNAVMDIVSHYDIDGLNLDYIHYPGRDWGYNPVSVARFNQRFGRKGRPQPSDPIWSQFRRDQTTALMRKIYLSAVTIKPQIKISAATITWPPAPKDDSEWLSRSAGYNNVFQDWRAWMEEGILDINMPMVYVPQKNLKYKNLFSDWVNFSRNHRYNRHVVITPAIYMNSVADALAQVRAAQTAGRDKTAADGVCLYSYASYSTDKVNRNDFLSALTRPSKYSGNGTPVFAKPVSTPEMPWKTKPTMGHLKGFIYSGSKTSTLDAAMISITGPKNKDLISDATGFYGAGDLPPGDYTLTISFPGCEPTTATCNISVGKVTTKDIQVNRTASP